MESKKTQAFSCLTWKFEDYDTLTVDEVTYVVGVAKGHIPEPYKSRNRSYEDYDLDYLAKRHLAENRVSAGMIEQDKKHRNQIIDRNDVLISLLHLFEHQPKPFSIYRDVSKYPIAVKESILEWCRKYGLPCQEFEEDLWTTHGYIGFRIDAFQTKLRDVYSGYLLWQRIKYGDKFENNPFRSETIDECKDMLRLKLDGISLHAQVDFGDVPRFLLGCENLFDMATVQLAFLLPEGNNETAVRCDECHSTFIRHHGSEMLCDECKPLRYRRTRRKQKAQRNGCEANAQESQQ